MNNITTDYLNILPGIGIGDLKFGSDLNMVKSYLGNPDEIKVCDNDDIHWAFQNINLNVYFSAEEQFRLSLLETHNADAKLWEVRIFGLNKEELFTHFRKKGFATPEIDNCYGGEFLYAYDECGCNVYFQDDRLESVQWSVLFDQGGDNIVWPN